MADAGRAAAALVETLNHEVNVGLADVGIRAKLANVGGRVIPGTAADFRKIIVDETGKWAKVVKEAGIKAERGEPSDDTSH